MRKTKRRRIPFDVIMSGAYEQLSELQKALYLELWVIADACDEIPSDAATIRRKTGRTNQKKRVEKALERFQELNLVQITEHGECFLIEPTAVSFSRTKFDHNLTQIDPQFTQDSPQIDPQLNPNSPQIDQGVLNEIQNIGGQKKPTTAPVLDKDIDIDKDKTRAREKRGGKKGGKIYTGFSKNRNSSY